ncbi:aro2 [Heliothis virescens ascovirus 3i]|nr:aro2 [Heliothis virescens ascovirus 3i]
MNDYITLYTTDGCCVKVLIDTEKKRDQITQWLRDLPDTVPVSMDVRGINDLSDAELAYKVIKNPPLKLWSRLRSAAWGVSEGSVTGMITASNSSGGGQWIFGTLSQVVGSTIGLFLGGAIFGTLGFMSDLKTIRTLLLHYRMSFNSNKRNRVRNSTMNLPRLSLNPIPFVSFG